jgi:anti-sigma regulatory factor (Ser/Thr protein kinase)
LENNRLIIEISDSGIPFDITKKADPDINASTEVREIGGLGIFLIKKMMDEVRYRREEGRNILDLIVTKE